MKTTKQFIDDLRLFNPNIEVIGEYTGSVNRIRVQCTICGNEWEPISTRLVSKKDTAKCPVCRSDPNWYTDKSYFANAYPELARHLANPDDGHKYKKMSSVKVDWVCPDCGEIVRGIPINKIAMRKHIPCKKCSDGISYPNKFMHSLLLQSGVDFRTEYSPDWIAPKRYDFYIPSLSLIVEMDGAIGHGRKAYDGSDGKDLLEIDHFKDSVAASHGLKVVRIDCFESDMEYISANILKSDLSTALNLSHIDWRECNRFALSSLQILVCNLWNERNDMQYVLDTTKLSRNTVIKYLHKCVDSGMTDYDPEKQHVLSGKRNMHKAYEANRKQVICLDTGEIFNSLREANAWLGFTKTSHTIQDNCKGKQKTAGEHPVTKKRLHWMFLSDYKAKEAV